MFMIWQEISMHKMIFCQQNFEIVYPKICFSIKLFIYELNNTLTHNAEATESKMPELIQNPSRKGFFKR